MELTEQTAFHEAGHAIAAVLMGHELERVAEGTAVNNTSWIREEAVISLASIAAEEFCLFSLDSYECFSDIRRGLYAAAIICEKSVYVDPLGDDADLESLLDLQTADVRLEFNSLLREARVLIRREWNAVRATAHALLHEGQLTGVEVETVLSAVAA